VGKRMVETLSLACQRSIATRMAIDPGKVSNTIINFLIEKLNDQRANGILIGLSGGIDSAVLTTIALRAVGPKHVFTLHLFDRDSQSKFLEHAKGLADKLGIHFEIRDITSLVEETGIYEWPVSGRIAILRGLNPLIIRLCKVFYYLMHRGHLGASMMNHTTVARSRIIRKLSSAIRFPIMRGFAIKHIVRRQVLEDYAAERNLLLVGAANRSEWLTGWFIKSGVDDLPIEPLHGLYKTQVYRLAYFLDVPSEIIDEPPSPDMFKGFSDETMIGASWEKIDRVLYILMKGLDKEIALVEGVTAGEFYRIKMRYELSHPKREGIRHYPSIQN
jgi:NAD+ synthase